MSLRGREPCTRFERQPRPLLPTCFLCLIVGTVERCATFDLVTGEEREGALHDAGERFMFAKAAFAETRAEGVELAAELQVNGRLALAAGLAGARQQPFQACLGGVERPTLRFPRRRALLVEGRSARHVPGARRKLRF